MLAPWLNAPLGSRTVCRHFQNFVSGFTTDQFHLHLDSSDGRRVPVGNQTVLTHAYVGFSWEDTSDALQNTLWSDDYKTGWQIWSPQQGYLTPLMPLAWHSTVTDTSVTSTGSIIQGSLAVPPAPIIAPIILKEGEQAFVRVTWAQGRVEIVGWVAGFTHPVVNDVPGGKRLFTEKMP